MHLPRVLAEPGLAADVGLPLPHPHRDLIVAVKVMRKVEFFFSQSGIETIAGQER